MSSSGEGVATKPRPLSQRTKRVIWGGIIAVLVLGVVLGTRVVPSADLVGDKKFDSVVFGEEHFPVIQEDVGAKSVDAVTLSGAIAADSAAAADEYAVMSSGGPVYSVSFTGVAGEGKSGVYPVTVDGLPAGQSIRVQTGPAINGTELRDATGDISFGQFTNQIEYQDAAAALNEQLKLQVLAGIDTASLAGKTITVTGVFTLINANSWLVTPVEITVA